MYDIKDIIDGNVKLEDSTFRLISISEKFNKEKFEVWGVQGIQTNKVYDYFIEIENAEIKVAYLNAITEFKRLKLLNRNVLEKLNTKRLLTYKKTKLYTFHSIHHEAVEYFNNNEKYTEYHLSTFIEAYGKMLKEILNKREHVEK